MPFSDWVGLPKSIRDKFHENVEEYNNHLTNQGINSSGLK